MNAEMFAQIQARKGGGGDGSSGGPPAGPNPLAAMLQNRNQKGPAPGAGAAAAAAAAAAGKPKAAKPKKPFKSDASKVFEYDDNLEAFLFYHENDTPSSDIFAPKLIDDEFGNAETNILIPLAPCIYRLCDYTWIKKEPILLQKCIIKLGVLRCLLRECNNMNNLLQHRDYHETLEEDELGKIRFMELLSSCGNYAKVSELVLKRAGQVLDLMKKKQKEEKSSSSSTYPTSGCGAKPRPGLVPASSPDKVTFTTGDSDNNGAKNPFLIPKICVNELEEFLQCIEEKFPELAKARNEIDNEQSVSFYPGLGELFCPGSKLVCHPEGMEGMPMGCSCVQSYYAEDFNKATNTVKRRFILVIEFIVSVGDELVFVAATDVYPEFHDLTRNVPIKDLTHRKLLPDVNADDKILLDRLQRRGEFYASVATKNHYLEYHPDSFFPILGGWNSNAVRPLSKGGRVMVDVKRGILEGHKPIGASSSDGLSDTVKEAIKLWDQSKRTGIAVPFRSCILPGFVETKNKSTRAIMDTSNRGDSDRPHLWQSWPMLVGFSFTARVWGKLLLSMPKSKSAIGPGTSPRRKSVRRLGVELAGLGGEGACGNCGYIKFQEQAFEQLVLAEDKKELIRAVARNAGGGVAANEDMYDTDDSDSDDDIDDVGIDVVANKGGASIFLLHGPPGCGKTLTAEAIAELLRKPLYIVTAGDLGITASEVEKTLGSVLDLCQTWDALVLIDEADVFLEARTSTEIERNALVCVMLRLLEYYSGCLFLSSNRAAGSIDAAIASRITVMLGYPPLDIEGRAKVWKNLIELVPSLPLDPATGETPDKIMRNPRKASKYRVSFDKADYEKLAGGYKLNGRQIKNSIVLARALARERGSPLSLTILDRAVTAVAGDEATI